MSIGKNLGLTPQQQLIQYVKNPQLAAAAGVPAASALFELQQRVEKIRNRCATERIHIRNGAHQLKTSFSAFSLVILDAM